MEEALTPGGDGMGDGDGDNLKNCSLCQIVSQVSGMCFDKYKQCKRYSDKTTVVVEMEDQARAHTHTLFLR